MTFVCATGWPQAKDWKHPCGSTVHVFDPVGLSDPPLGSLPAALQREIEKTLRPLLAKEAHITGSDEDGSDIGHPKSSVHIHLIASRPGGKQLYAAWWYIPIVCGQRGACPIWLLEADSGTVRNLVRPGPHNPAGDTAGGWGIAVLPSEVQSERLMIVDSAFAQAAPQCWRRRGNFYVIDPCPPSCMADLNRINR